MAQSQPADTACELETRRRAKAKARLGAKVAVDTEKALPSVMARLRQWSRADGAGKAGQSRHGRGLRPRPRLRLKERTRQAGQYGLMAWPPPSPTMHDRAGLGVSRTTRARARLGHEGHSFST